ncbi:hypothetical protein NEIMUCOT_04599 [Neisseria mucosa ATCC 25996]|uniref:Uncharacterized protein n=1 Tax=Neisseria mucosa (strain ATCC 25996 / DSM 4631 / NCTC 10774 / M26) TaxID=546266 RepID=D2ZVF6_NEIM2|nr:hypothetical protein NEIMUCOT_04599 [Neisseria mucosa ATCC 25996]
MGDRRPHSDKLMRRYKGRLKVGRGHSDDLLKFEDVNWASMV